MSYYILAKRGPNVSLNGASAEIDFMCPTADDWTQIYDDMMAFEYEDDANGYKYTMRAQHPDFPCLWAADIKSEAFLEAPPNDDSAFYPDGYKVTVSYTAKCLNRPADPRAPVPDDGDYNTSYVTMETHGAGEFFHLPKSQLQWQDKVTEDDTRTMSEAVEAGIMVPINTHTVTWSNITSPPWDAIDGLLGKVNDADFPETADRQFHEECILFIGYELKLTFNESSGSVYEIVFVFNERAIAQTYYNSDEDAFNDENAQIEWAGWNHVVRANAPGTPTTYEFANQMLWQRTILLGTGGDGDGDGMYLRGSFDDLFVQV